MIVDSDQDFILVEDEVVMATSEATKISSPNGNAASL
jgi:hypothetical protein